MSQGGVFGLPLLFDILDPSNASKNSSFLLRLRHLSIGNPCISRQLRRFRPPNAMPLCLGFQPWGGRDLSLIRKDSLSR